jgi:hypothetical protein
MELLSDFPLVFHQSAFSVLYNSHILPPLRFLFNSVALSSFLPMRLLLQLRQFLPLALGNPLINLERLALRDLDLMLDAIKGVRGSIGLSTVLVSSAAGLALAGKPLGAGSCVEVSDDCLHELWKCRRANEVEGNQKKKTYQPKGSYSRSSVRSHC